MRPTPYVDPLENTWPNARTSRPEEHSEARPLVTRVFGRTDRGRRRPSNEDRFLIASPVSTLWTRPSSPHANEAPLEDIEGELFVVADGMGGHQGGAQASALAVQAVEASLLSTLGRLFALGDVQHAGVEMLDQMNAAVRSADARVCDAAAKTPGLHDMGTTLTMAYRYGSWLFVAHAGDSRCYLQRGGKLHRITQDHTLVGEMLRRGIIDTNEAAHHELRHIVTNAVGGPTPGVKSEGHRLRLAPGDVLILCTDGLTDMVTETEISQILLSEDDPRAACDRLIRLANDHGGHDNITCIVARFEPATARVDPSRAN